MYTGRQQKQESESGVSRYFVERMLVALVSFCVCVFSFLHSNRLAPPLLTFFVKVTLLHGSLIG